MQISTWPTLIFTLKIAGIPIVASRIVLAVILLFSTAVPVNTALAGQTLTWLEAPAPPFFIQEGELKGQGYEDMVTQIVIDRLPEYQHEHLVASITRHYQEFKEGRQACSIGLFKTPEREKFLYFSKPSFFTLPVVIVINKENYAAFAKAKSVKLADVLHKNLVIGRAKNRSYGKNIDDVLARQGTDQNTYSFEGGDLSLTLFEMLKRHRLDGLLSLPEEAMYHAERLGIRDKIMTLTIEETQNSYESWFSYVACAKTAWGKETIDKINTILEQERPTDRYRATYERWLDESSYQGYRQLYNDVFLKAKK